MDAAVPESLMALCKRVEAFETPRWAIEALLDVELTTRFIVDPCAGTGIIPAVVELKTGIQAILAHDIVPWKYRTPEAMKWKGPIGPLDFLKDPMPSLVGATVIMNPPFSKACEFVDRARNLGARKIMCFQRQAWRESMGRRAWWAANPPARVWVCGARASCWHFDLLGTEKAAKSGTPTSYAWYVYEAGHKGAEVTSAIYPKDDPHAD
jgi:hypothetical protein